MIDKSDSVNWENVWWILGADYLTFEGVMGDFRKKKFLPTDFERKKACKEIPTKTIPCTEKNITHDIKCRKKSYTVYTRWRKISNCRAGGPPAPQVGEKLLPQLNHPYPPPPQKSNGHVNNLRGGGRNGFDTLVNVIHQQNGLRAFNMWWFSRLIRG